MLFCIECRASFPRLCDIQKHERTHRLRLWCMKCDAYFTTKERHQAHMESHTRDCGTQTDPVRVYAKQPARRSEGSKASKRPSESVPVWRPAKAPMPSPMRAVPSKIVATSESLDRLFSHHKGPFQGHHHNQSVVHM